MLENVPLTEYVGKKIKFVLNLPKANEDGHLAVEVEGTIDIVAPNGSALVIKEKGHTMTRFIEVSAIEPGTMELVQEKPRELKSKRLDPLTLSNARQHLLDRHEFQLKAINDMTDEAAVQAHNDIDHSELGHYHAPRELADAVNEAAAEPELANA